MIHFYLKFSENIILIHVVNFNKIFKLLKFIFIMIDFKLTYE